MSVKRTLLALGVLAVVMSLSCDRPIGLSGSDVHTAATQTTYCYVADDTLLTGHVDWYQTGQINSYYDTCYDVIRRGYTDSAGLQHPRMNGFCTFEVPDFQADTEAAPVVCSLIYYQSAHYGSADLRVTWLDQIITAPYDYVEVFWNAWEGSYQIAEASAQDEGRHALLLSDDAADSIAALGARGGGSSYITGWTYTGSVSGTYADVICRGDSAPRIKVIYDDGQ